MREPDSGKERIARALDGMGCRRTRVVLTECLEVVLDWLRVVSDECNGQVKQM